MPANTKESIYFNKNQMLRLCELFPEEDNLWNISSPDYYKRDKKMSDKVGTGTLYKYNKEWYESQVATYLSVRDSLSAGTIDLRMLVSCFWINGVTFVRSSSKSWGELFHSSMFCSQLSSPMYPCRRPSLGRLRRILTAALAIIIKHKEIATFSSSITFFNTMVAGNKNLQDKDMSCKQK